MVRPAIAPAAFGDRDHEPTRRKRIVSIGEVMIEMTRGADGRFGQACGGDTFNTAVYLARRGLPVAYATALGDDPYSDGIVSLAAAEGIATDLMLRVPGRLPGLYLVETDPAGERTFRISGATGSPARELFELPDWGRIAEAMIGARIVYFSGITLSLYSNNGLGRFLAVLEMARQDGAKVVFDGNYRPRGWKGDIAAHPHGVHGGAEARRHRAADLRRRGGALGRSIAGGDGRAAAGVRHRRDRGQERLRTARWSRPAAIAKRSRCRRWWCRSIPRRRATASMPATWRRGSPDENPADAAICGHRLAAEVIRHRGAIMPRSAGAVH